MARGKKITQEEMITIIKMWDNSPITEIANAIGKTKGGIHAIAKRLRSNGVPLKERDYRVVVIDYKRLAEIYKDSSKKGTE